jgi:hypothetical protein
MKTRLTRYFIVSAGTLLFITAAAKIISSGGSSRILDIRDPVLRIHFRYLFLTSGILEMMLALVCILGKNALLQAKLIAWLSSVLLIYRINRSLLGAAAICNCLGTLTDAIRLPSETADLWMKIILGYLLAGSSAILLLSWQKRGHPTITTKA